MSDILQSLKKGLLGSQYGVALSLLPSLLGCSTKPMQSDEDTNSNDIIYHEGTQVWVQEPGAPEPELYALAEDVNKIQSIARAKNVKTGKYKYITLVYILQDR